MEQQQHKGNPTNTATLLLHFYLALTDTGTSITGPPPRCSLQTHLEKLRMPLDVLGHIDTNIAKLGVCGGLARGDDRSESNARNVAE